MFNLHTGFDGSPQEPSIRGSFLDRVLATQGVRCGAQIKDKICSHGWFQTNQELADWLQTISADADAYHCNATFPRSGSRKKNEGCFYRAVWVDIDLKPFAAALDVLTEFCATTETPRPSVIVSSGGGLHAYWVFTRDLSLDEWTRVSRALNAFCTVHGLGHDSKCTIDAVRILRPPGTLNHKYDPNPDVEGDETGPDHDYESFVQGLETPIGGPVLRGVNGHAAAIAFIKSEPTPYTREGVTRLCSALGAIDAACDHGTWRDVMFALKFLTGHGWPDHSCYTILGNWSATASKYRVEPHFSSNYNQWKAASSGGGITDATIFDMAVKRGWGP
jgi:Primase C terminal 2 (PriCT-2)